MSALFLAIPLTIFVLFVLPIWLWLHCNRSGRSELSQSEQQRLAQLADEANGCANVFRRWNPFLMQNIRTGGSLMAGINLNKKLWRIPQQGMVRGVCAGIANYFDVPVKLVRIPVVLSIFLRSGAVYPGLLTSFCHLRLINAGQHGLW